MSYLPALSFRPETRIVLVGTTECPQDPVLLPPVPHARKNIDYLERLFTDPSICGLDSTCIVRIVDWEHASQITNGIAKAAQEATDTLLVYYVGHGLYGDAETPVFLAACTTTEAGKTYNGVSVALVKKAMKQSRARKRILILDCCYSGRAMDGGLGSTDIAAALEPAIDLEGTFGIAAVPANAKALAPPGEDLTRFTGALIEVLEHGLKTDRPVLTLEDVFDEVEGKIGRKADAPLPRRINWAKGEQFGIALNRYLPPRPDPELTRLIAAVEGLRVSLAATGAQLQAVEARTAGIEEMAARLGALETTLAANDGKGTRPWVDEVQDGPSPVWKRVGLTAEQWQALPAKPFKLTVNRFFDGRRNASILLGVAGFLAMAAVMAEIMLPPQLWNQYRFVIPLPLGILAASIAPVLIRDLLPSRSDLGFPPDDSFLGTQERFVEAMEARILEVFGLPLQRGNTYFAFFLALAGLAAVMVLDQGNLYRFARPA